MLMCILGPCAFRLSWVFTVVSAHHVFRTLMMVYPISWVLTGCVMTTAYLLTRRKLFTALAEN